MFDEHELYSINQIKLAEELAINQYGLSSYELLSCASFSAFKMLLKFWPNSKNIVVVCSNGKNGMYGYILAYYAKKIAKLEVTILEIYSSNCSHVFKSKVTNECISIGIKILPFNSEQLQYKDVIIDAIHGIEMQIKLKNDLKRIVKLINDSKIPVLSIDIPTGINANTGNIFSNIAIIATITVTFIGDKIGLYTGKAVDYVGKIIVCDLNLNKNIFTSIKYSAKKLNLESDILPLLPRKRDSHKGNFGHVLVIGGDNGMSGAVRLAGEAALRIGSGLVSIFTKSANTFINIGCPELLVYDENWIDLKKLIYNSSVILLGPGLGTSSWAKNIFDIVINSNKPLIIDADGLNILAMNRHFNKNWILTPHPGEAARLLNIKIQNVQSNRISTVKKIYKNFGGVIALKGSGTILFAKKRTIRICVNGNPGMATAGMGDVLSGMIAGLVAQGLCLFNAAKLGVLIHALIGDSIANKKGMRGMIAGDILSGITDIINIH